MVQLQHEKKDKYCDRKGGNSRGQWCIYGQRKEWEEKGKEKRGMGMGMGMKPKRIKKEGERKKKRKGTENKGDGRK